MIRKITTTKDQLSMHIFSVGFNLQLAEGVRRDVWIADVGDGFVIVAMGDFDQMYFNPESPTGWNSHEGEVFEEFLGARVAFANWYSNVSI